jgi:hypothetical protein
MEYNTQKTQLHLPEYGRIIQQLVERCKELPTKEERTKWQWQSSILWVRETRNFETKKIININFGIIFIF